MSTMTDTVLDWEWQAMDGAMTKAPLEDKEPVPILRTGAKSGTKRRRPDGIGGITKKTSVQLAKSRLEVTNTEPLGMARNTCNWQVRELSNYIEPAPGWHR